MFKFLKNNFYLILLALAVAVVFFKFFNLLNFRDPEAILEKGEAIKMTPGHSFVQNFKANRNNLSRVEFLLGTGGINKEDKVIMRLKDEVCSDTIREGALEPSFLSSDNLYDFRFEKIPDSKDKVYCLTATFETQRAKAKKVRIFARNIDASQNQFSFSDATDGKKFENQSLSIRPVYTNENWRQNISELNQRISQYKPFFLKHYFLYAIVFGFLILSVALVIILITL